MIKITYEVTCDVCRMSIIEPQEFTIDPYLCLGDSISIPKPWPLWPVGNLQVCDSCRNVAYSALSDHRNKLDAAEVHNKS